jgi:hypothetical protein
MELDYNFGINIIDNKSMSFSLDKYSMKVECKHPSPDSYRDALRVTVRLSVVPA